MLEEYVRRTFRISAVRITEENIDEAARMVGSGVRMVTGFNGEKLPCFELELPESNDGKRTISVFVGNWLTWSNGKFNRFTNKTFNSTFGRDRSAEKIDLEHNTNPVIHARNHEVLQLVRKAVREGIAEGTTELETAEDIAYNIIKLFYTTPSASGSLSSQENTGSTDQAYQALRRAGKYPWGHN